LGKNGLPRVVTPRPTASANSGVEALVGLVDKNRTAFDELLVHAGAILFRGFAVRSPTDFHAVVQALGGQPLGYIGGISPRRRVGDGVYTSTEYPPEDAISLHSELSYAARWPQRLYFCCLLPASSGGDTPLVDNRVVLDLVNPDLLARMDESGVMYVRNLHGGRGPGRSWQDTYGTEDRALIERDLTADGVEFTWRGDGLRTVAIRPATTVHPATDQQVWFNQAESWHLSYQDEATRRALLELCGPENLPMQACFGDGTPFDEGELDQVRRLTWGQSCGFAWSAGDVLVIDNVLVGHGRAPFRPPRRHLVAMT
jgi:hypothetical protein